ncbi:MAG: hypothetical protein HXX08_08555 [Chloroflexi bacterium]|uniref:Uncharacterized protein n=1 Tax=Candidatus Chlorohelix allophototropha TaxID=3003348 RepID=A0A8T7M3G6_9CHLR|nr:hypothetical protein [Chloroflexota bacterium]WJW67776.1 hypothetical protein OZ401_001055 [Chloroflexota bacterium L227-S17]
MNSLAELLQEALISGNASELESYLKERSNLPGPRMNLPLVYDFAELVKTLVTLPESPVAQLELLLEGWSSITVEANAPETILPSAAVASYGQMAAVLPDCWQEKVARLYKAALSESWRVREMVAQALQAMLEKDWERTVLTLGEWLKGGELLALRAVVAAVAEPRLLKEYEHTYEALQLQREVVRLFIQVTPAQRKHPTYKTLRQALGYSISVAIASLPDDGLHYFSELEKSGNPDIQWIVRENKKKARLYKLISQN